MFLSTLAFVPLLVVSARFILACFLTVLASLLAFREVHIIYF